METKTSFLAHAKCLKAAYDICQPSSVLTDEQLSLSQRYMAVASYVRKTAGEKHDVESRNRAVERMVDEALRCNAVVSILDTEVLEQKFSPEFAEQIQEVKLPATHLEILVKMLRKRIREQKHANKVAAEKFEELLRKRLEAYHKQQAAFSDEEASETQSETVMAIINEATRLAMKLLQQLRQDKERLRALGLTFEEKAFYDILMHLRGKYHFAYGLDRRVGSITPSTTSAKSWRRRSGSSSMRNPP